MRERRGDGRGPTARRRLIHGAVAWLAAAAVAVAADRAAALDLSVDMTLVLAVDTSASVDAEEYALQRGGLAAAFRDREVAEAIAAGPLKRIAVSVIEWAGAAQQVQVVAWTLVDGPGGALALADRIDSLERAIPTGATSIAGALAFGTALLRTAPYETARRVIDLSGDGRNNQGQDVEDVRRVVVAQGVTINGLAILNEHPTLDYYFRDRVVGGTGAFVEVAHDYNAYVGAIRRKLIREIRSLTVSGRDPDPDRSPTPATRLPESRVRLAAAPPTAR
ncbi:MAG: DUF1194 domain-containing protein [Thalassobaculum sp.]|uniref:DUF1194 domain-containing protein n=1 Tax=Thalassobaculum sp. TaxID=2022740 RepID=UPI0032EC17B1